MTPRTQEQMWIANYGDWVVLAQFSETLELETQQLAEALRRALRVLEGEEDFRAVEIVRDVLAAHKARQPKS